MNIENIAALAGMIESLGFKGLGGSLLKRIAFRPSDFSLSYHTETSENKVSFELFFVKDIDKDNYKFLFYEATLKKPEVIHANIAGVDTNNLEKKMQTVDWKEVFVTGSEKLFEVGDKASWKIEETIEGIVTDLELLDSDLIGKEVAVNLKSKFWDGLPYEAFVKSSHSGKGKNDITQRFYYLEGRPCIGAEEALRFLLNRSMEKEMLARKKAIGVLDLSAEKRNVQDKKTGPKIKSQPKGQKINRSINGNDGTYGYIL